MILLKRNIKFYGYLLVCIAALIIIVFLLLNLRGGAANSDKVVFMYIFSFAYLLVITYIIFTIISAVRRVDVSDEGILFGKEEWKWSEIKEIRFSEIGFLLGKNENQTVIVDTRSKRQIIYNSYYSNFAAFSSYLFAKRDQLQHIEIFPKEAASTTNYSINKKYKAFKILSLYNFALLLSVAMFVVPLLTVQTIVLYWGSIVLMTFFTILFAIILYTANYIEIDGHKVYIRKLFFPSVRSYELSEIDDVVFYQNGSSAAQMMVIDKMFVARSCFISNVKLSVLKELKNDLEKMGITVTYKL